MPKTKEQLLEEIANANSQTSVELDKNPRYTSTQEVAEIADAIDANPHLHSVHVTRLYMSRTATLNLADRLLESDNLDKVHFASPLSLVNSPTQRDGMYLEEEIPERFAAHNATVEKAEKEEVAEFMTFAMPLKNSPQRKRARGRTVSFAATTEIIPSSSDATESIEQAPKRQREEPRGEDCLATNKPRVGRKKQFKMD